MSKLQIGQVVMLKADDTYVKAKITDWKENGIDFYQVNMCSKEWLPSGNLIPIDEFIINKAKKLLECAPTKRALDMPKLYPKDYKLGCAYHQVMVYYQIKIDEINKIVQEHVIDYLSASVLG